MIGMIGGLSMNELLIILVIVLLLFGAKRLPGLAKGMGESLRAFKTGVGEREMEEKEEGMLGSERGEWEMKG